MQIKYFLLALGCCVAVQAPAQQIPSRPIEAVRRDDSRIDQVKVYQQLHLNAGQQQKLRTLQKEGRQQAAAIRNDPQLTVDQKKDQLKQVFKEQNAKRNAILTPEQQKTWAELGLGKKQDRTNDIVTVAQRTMQPEKGYDKNGLPQKTVLPRSNLNLTQTQRQKMADLNTRFGEKARSIKNDSTLSDDQKKDRLTALQKEMRGQRKEMLTPQQLRQWKALNNQQKRSAINF
ncbi:MAG: hypothetical protein J7539_02700 [Niabella sp.]|nr:hypothetical protein [Niabella sp.]